MDLSSARTRVRDYLNEQEAAEWSDAQIDRLVVQSNFDVYHILCDINPWLFAKNYRFSYPSDSLSVSLGSVTPSGGGSIDSFEDVLSVFTLTSDASPSSSNHPSRVVQSDHLADLYQARQDRVGTRRALKWFVVEDDFYMTPFSTDARTVWIWITPVVFSPSADAHDLLSTDGGSSGNYDQFHELIVLLSAARAKACVDDQMSLVWGLYQHKLSIVKSKTNPTRSRMVPSKVRV
tara:strand:+ start:98 stop:799 length:702 start_codon:yes stop_codon:yes gene_type:complete